MTRCADFQGMCIPPPSSKMGEGVLHPPGCMQPCNCSPCSSLLSETAENIDIATPHRRGQGKNRERPPPNRGGQVEASSALPGVQNPCPTTAAKPSRLLGRSHSSVTITSRSCVSNCRAEGTQDYLSRNLQRSTASAMLRNSSRSASDRSRMRPISCALSRSRLLWPAAS
jgi:hypothetical protein